MCTDARTGRSAWGHRWPVGEFGSQGKSVLWALGAGAVVVSAAALRELLGRVQLAGPPSPRSEPAHPEISLSRNATEISRCSVALPGFACRSIPG